MYFAQFTQTLAVEKAAKSSSLAFLFRPTKVLADLEKIARTGGDAGANLILPAHGGADPGSKVISAESAYGSGAPVNLVADRPALGS
jgi:hypothetical protein